MPAPGYSTGSIVAGQTQDAVPVKAAFDALKTLLNGGLDGDNLSSSVGDRASVSGAGVSRRAKCIIATEETMRVGYDAFATDPFTYAPTPDKVTLDVPSAGMVHVIYWALWKESHQGFGAASLMVDGLNVPYAGTPSPTYYNAVIDMAAPSLGNYRPLHTAEHGLVGTEAFAVTADHSVVTTGQSLAGDSQSIYGNVTRLWLPAGEHEVGVGYAWYDETKSPGLTIKERKLYAWVEDG